MATRQTKADLEREIRGLRQTLVDAKESLDVQSLKFEALLQRLVFAEELVHKLAERSVTVNVTQAPTHETFAADRHIVDPSHQNADPHNMARWAAEMEAEREDDAGPSDDDMEAFTHEGLADRIGEVFGDDWSPPLDKLTPPPDLEEPNG